MHPDVKRMLMQMRAMTAAARTICYATAVALDVSVRAKDAKVRADAAARGALLTPIAKAFSTDIGNEVAYLGVQVHGGMGFIEETGAAQHYRDARITTIYEGTNGIQSIDLVTRKLAANGGASVLGAARRALRHRQAGRGLERSRLRHHGPQTARRAGFAGAQQQMAAGARRFGAERRAGRPLPERYRFLLSNCNNVNQGLRISASSLVRLNPLRSPLSHNTFFKRIVATPQLHNPDPKVASQRILLT